MMQDVQEKRSGQDGLLDRHRRCFVLSGVLSFFIDINALILDLQRSGVNSYSFDRIVWHGALRHAEVRPAAWFVAPRRRASNAGHTGLLHNPLKCPVTVLIPPSPH